MSVIEISCVHVWSEISNYIEGDLDPALRERMAAHFKTCAHCSAILDGTKNVIGLVADGKSFDLPQGFSERLKRRLAQTLPKR
ncbi:MAG TPA: zf-HC2 domain-containing protein [Terriglobales bacterium]|nr:zf-HC2 domain-containing protein [Terriglobales bacterium]